MNGKKHVFAMFLAVIMVFWAPSAIYARDTGETTIIIYHTNDTHGRFVQADNIIGIPTIAAIKEDTPNSLLVDAGDTFHGLPFVTMNKGADAVELMNLAGYDVMTPGNHDFNYGYQRLQELAEIASFDIISANLKKDGELLLSASHLVKEVDGVKIGFFGISTPETLWKASPKFTEGLVFDDVIESAKESVEALKGLDVNVIVALTHIGTDKSSIVTSEVLADAVPEIDIIIDGHSHSLFEEGLLVNGVLIASAKEYEAFLGKVTLVIGADGKLVSKEASVIDFQTATSKFEPNAAVLEKLEAIKAEQDIVLNQVVTTINMSLSADREPGVRTQEMPLGNLVADALRDVTGADIAFTNGGGLRANLNAGEITKGDIIAVLPFGNYAVTKKITVSQLKEILENGVAGLPAAAGAFPQISGFSFECDPSLPVGSRVTKITINGKDIDTSDTKTTLLAATNDFIAVGGDGYTMFGSLPTENEFQALDEILAEYITTSKLSYAETEGRVVIGAPQLVPDTAAKPEPAPVAPVGTDAAFAPNTTAFVANCYFVNMRSGSNTNYAPVNILAKETEVIITGRQYEWFKVLYNGTEGWIYEDYLMQK